MRTLFLLGFSILASASHALECSDSKVAEELCDTIEQAEACLRDEASCKDVNYIAGRLTAGLLLLGKVEGALLGLSTAGPVDGGVANKVRFFKMGLRDPAWWATSRDGNWIQAVNQANKSIRESLGRIEKLIK
jgi:hypothetical protein